jgi:hypothetical protein
MNGIKWKIEREFSWWNNKNFNVKSSSNSGMCIIKICAYPFGFDVRKDNIQSLYTGLHGYE